MNAHTGTPLLDRSSSKKNAREDEPELDGHSWRLEPHVCSKCFARVASAVLTEGGDSVYRCTNCGHEARGATPAAICACGIKLRKPVTGRAVGNPFYDAGMRCHANPEVSPAFPSLFVASYVGTTKRR